MSTNDLGNKEDAKKRLDKVFSERGDKVLEGPEWLCTVHLKLRIPCDNTCGFLDNWERDHEKCPRRVHKTDVVFGRIFGNKEGWVKKT